MISCSFKSTSPPSLTSQTKCHLPKETVGRVKAVLIEVLSNDDKEGDDKEDDDIEIRDEKLVHV